MAQDRDPARYRWMRALLLSLALLTSPALCCGSLQLLDSLPSSWLPSSLSFILNLFESSARIENKTPETLYVTAVTTTYGDPRVIPQNIAFRQRDIPIGPESSIVIQYDSADLPLSGIVVCRDPGDCRLLPAGNSDVYELSSYEDLENLEPGWLEAVQSTALHNYSTLVTVGLSLVSLFLFSGWILLTRREKRSVRNANE